MNFPETTPHSGLSAAEAAALREQITAAVSAEVTNKLQGVFDQAF